MLSLPLLLQLANVFELVLVLVSNSMISLLYSTLFWKNSISIQRGPKVCKGVLCKRSCADKNLVEG